MKEKSLKNKKLLLLGGSAQQIVAIETAKRLGLITVLCDYLPDNPGQYHADKFYLVSTTDKDAVLDVALKESIDGIIAYASDPAAPTAAYVAEKMGLPTNPYEAVNILCNKDKFREFLLNNGFNVPKAMGFESGEDALQSIGSLRLPIIIKPVDSSGSKGVTVLNELSGLDDAMDFAFSRSRSHRVIVEEFIEKSHPYLVGGDIFVCDGRIVQWGLMNCHRDPAVNPLVPVGKSFPALLSYDELLAAKDALQNLVSALGIRFGAMNIELVLDGEGKAYLIDVGPRSGGNMIPDLLSLIFKCDVVEMSIRAAMGEEISSEMNDAEAYYATLNLHSDKDGIFEDITYSSSISNYIIRKEIYKKPGDPVERFNNAAHAIGIIFFKFPDQSTMLDMEEHMNEHIKIVLKQ